MKKKLLLLLFSLITIHFCNGQNIIIDGRIIDDKSNQSLPYATIELFGLNTGTIADINGKFLLEITSKDFKTDTIVFSHIGYEKIRKSIEDFLKSEKIIKLNEQPIVLGEVKVSPKDYLIKVVGVKDKKTNRVQYTGAFGANKGNFLRNKRKEVGMIQSVSYYLHPDGYPNCPFRVRIYEVDKNNRPGKDLLNVNLVVSAQKSGWFKIDISDYKIPFPKEGAFVMMEWINSGEDFYFEKRVTVKGENGQPKTVNRKYYGQTLGTISKKGGVVMWGTTLGNEWIPYDFAFRGNNINSMINAEIAYEKN